MKKLFKISAALMALSMVVTSAGMTALADGETASQKILLYEDMENITLDDFDKTTNRVHVYNNILNSIFTDKQYAYGTRDNYTTHADIQIKTEVDGNKVFSFKNTNTTAVSATDGNLGKLWMKFDSSWVLDSTNSDKLVVAYDISAKEIYAGQEESGFMGVPYCFDSTNKFYEFENFLYAGGIMRSIATDENNKTTLSYAMRNTNGAAIGNSNSTEITEVSLGDVVRVALVIDNYEQSTAPVYKVVLFNEEGKIVLSGQYSSGQNGSFDAATSLDGMAFRANMGIEYVLDNVKAYTLPADKVFAVTSTDAVDVPITSSLDVKLNGYVTEGQLGKITVKKGDEAVDPSEYTITAKENTSAVETTVSVKFNDKMSFGTTYSVVLPTTLKDETTTALAEETTVNFTTQAAPSFDVALAVTSGGEAVTALSGAAGKTVLCDVDVTHTTTRDSSGVIFVGLYDAEGNVVAYGSTDKAYTPNETDEIKVSLNVPADTTGMSIKAFACEGIAKIDNIFSNVATLQ